MKIQLKRSNQMEGGKAKTPSSAQMEYGELAINYNSEDPTFFIKDSADQIISLKVNSADVPSGGTPPSTGNSAGDLFYDTNSNELKYWNGSEWKVIPSETTTDGKYVQLSGGNTTQTITGTGGLKTEGLIESDGGVKVSGGQVTLPGGGTGTEALQADEINSLITNAEDPLLGNYLRTDAAAGAQVVESTDPTEFSGGVKVSGGQAYFAGNVGIGKDDPQAKLDVVGAATFSGRVDANKFRTLVGGSELEPTIMLGFDNDTGLFHPASNNIGFTTFGVERMRIDDLGNLGVGTTSPQEKLDVNGSAVFAGGIQAAAFRIDLLETLS